MGTKHIFAARRIGDGGHIEHLGRILSPENRSRWRVDDTHPTIVQLHHVEVGIPLRLSHGDTEVRLVLRQIFDASLDIFNRAQRRRSGNYYKKFGNFVVQRSERANRVLPHEQFSGIVTRKLAGPNKGHFRTEAFANCRDLVVLGRKHYLVDGRATSSRFDGPTQQWLAAQRPQVLSTYPLGSSP